MIKLKITKVSNSHKTIKINKFDNKLILFVLFMTEADASKLKHLCLLKCSISNTRLI